MSLTKNNKYQNMNLKGPILHDLSHTNNIHIHLYSYFVKTGQEGMLEQQNDSDISQIHLRSVFKTKLPFMSMQFMTSTLHCIDVSYEI